MKGAFAGVLIPPCLWPPNFACRSPLAHRAVETDYALVPEDALIAEAKNVLRNARLTTFAVTTKAEAVAVILGIRGKRGRYVHPM